MTFKVTLGICSHRWLSMGTFKTAWQLAKCPDPEITPVFQEGDALISRSRNRVATHFLKNTDSEILVFLDDDIEITPFDLTRMLWEVHQNKYDIMGAAYALKDPDKGGFAFLTESNEGTIRLGEGGEICPVKRVSTGCMAIRREVLEKMAKETVHFCKQGYYTFFQHREERVDGEWNDLSEDWWFCKKAKDLGFKVMLDPRPKTYHHGLFPYSWDWVSLNGGYVKKKSVDFSYKF